MFQQVVFVELVHDLVLEVLRLHDLAVLLVLLGDLDGLLSLVCGLLVSSLAVLHEAHLLLLD